ncbi:trimeric intracellular cation channel family protein [Alkalibacillus haloalkaliphilus]|uniref:trimeric intracellular cation channel family protein n=1 Tax=Alkalibacillus haloalkaliphilus TaxID=94136 RepID=UPI00293622DA|nr:trimeric intracellular cation channel family protein [Alkalibacillus haloalkaliphilus]MDV2583089.1 trimeric intracellular cation channel family protein [Alkalibacillus haloalkaliphilus]
MTWEILNVIGTMAFGISGAIVALEEKYDLFGVYLLGFTTAFGGGLIRHVVLGLPVSEVWEQSMLFFIAFITLTLIFFIPFHWFFTGWEKWGAFFDSIGLSAFAIQGALFAVAAGYPLPAVIVGSVLTGTGGGMVRDLLAGRKPLVLHKEIYAMWAVLGALAIGLGIAEAMWELMVLLVLIITLRMLSVIYDWRLPSRGDWLRFLKRLKKS